LAPKDLRHAVRESPFRSRESGHPFELTASSAIVFLGLLFGFQRPNRFSRSPPVRLFAGGRSFYPPSTFLSSNQLLPGCPSPLAPDNFSPAGARLLLPSARLLQPLFAPFFVPGALSGSAASCSYCRPRLIQLSAPPTSSRRLGGRHLPPFPPLVQPLFRPDSFPGSLGVPRPLNFHSRPRPIQLSAPPISSGALEQEGPTD
jgi:hypothetical protein